MIYAIDCDLRKIYIHGEDRPVFNASTVEPVVDWIVRQPRDHVILFELASQLSYGDRARFTSNREWLLYNMAVAARLSAHFPLLTSPSHVWTQGYDIKVRHALAKADAKNKDLRECQAMIWFYKQYPEHWKPLWQRLEPT